MNKIEADRAGALLQAQQKANELFKAVETRGLIRANVLESQLNQDIYDLATEMFGISTYWHKRIVRAGRNTLAPYDENPPDLTVGEDDILFLDLGPVFEEWEADFGRTFVLGSDPVKLKLREDISNGFLRGQSALQEQSGHHGRAAFSSSSETSGELRLGIWRHHRGTSNRPLSSRANCRRQSHPLRSSRQSEPDA
jgi:Xaa-Pro dipeptidase